MSRLVHVHVYMCTTSMQSQHACIHIDIDLRLVFRLVFAVSESDADAYLYWKPNVPTGTNSRQAVHATTAGFFGSPLSLVKKRAGVSRCTSPTSQSFLP